MKTLHIDATELGLDFDASLNLAKTIADNLLEETMLLSWYDRERNLESPAHVSECHENCPVPGWWDYAANRGGTLAVNFSQGRFIFCFLPLA